MLVFYDRVFVIIQEVLLRDCNGIVHRKVTIHGKVSMYLKFILQLPKEKEEHARKFE